MVKKRDKCEDVDMPVKKRLMSEDLENSQEFPMNFQSVNLNQSTEHTSIDIESMTSNLIQLHDSNQSIEVNLSIPIDDNIESTVSDFAESTQNTILDLNQVIDTINQPNLPNLPNVSSQPIDSINDDLNQVINTITQPVRSQRSIHDGKWDKMYQYLVQYAEHHGNANVPALYFIQDPSNSTKQINIGSWVANQKYLNSKGHLRNDRYQKLKELSEKYQFDFDFAEDSEVDSTDEANTNSSRKVFNIQDQRWEMMYSSLVKFLEEHNSLHIPNTFTVPDKFSTNGKKSYNLTHWLNTQKQLFSKNSLRKDRREKLQVFVDDGLLDCSNRKWNTYYEALLAWGDQQGHYNIKERETVTLSGQILNLGRWLDRMRVRYNKGILQPDRAMKIQHLISSGKLIQSMTLEDDKRWYFYFQILKRWGEEHDGDCNAPKNAIVTLDDGTIVKIGRWLAKQRSKNKLSRSSPGCLRIDRFELLNSLVIAGKLKWSFGLEYKFRWIIFYETLIQVANTRRMGDCNIPKHEKVITSTIINNKEEEIHLRLGLWLNKQRELYAAGKLKSDREMKLQLLVNLGRLSWELDNGMSKSTIRNYSDSNVDSDKLERMSMDYQAYHEMIQKHHNAILRSDLPSIDSSINQSDFMLLNYPMQSSIPLNDVMYMNDHEALHPNHPLIDPMKETNWNSSFSHSIDASSNTNINSRGNLMIVDDDEQSDDDFHDDDDDNNEDSNSDDDDVVIHNTSYMRSSSNI